MKIHAIICIYNCHETIRECLKSLEPIVDNIVLCEGRWKGVEGKSVLSDDGTYGEIANWLINTSFKGGFTWIRADELIHQYEVRNLLLDQVPIGDWFIVIDSDETIIKFPQNLREILENAKENGKEYNGFRCGGLDEIQESGPRPYALPKLLRKTRGMKYHKNHRYLTDDNGQIDLGHCPTLIELVIFHQGTKKAMRPVMDRYKRWLNQWETQNQ